MGTNNNNQHTQRVFIDAAANMLEVLPGDILIIRPKPKHIPDQVS